MVLGWLVLGWSDGGGSPHRKTSTRVPKESPNQDSFSLLRVEGKFDVYGIYDGHGPKGHDVSNFIKDAAY